MKKIILVRHAKSSWDFPELDDYDRPLNKRGEKNAPEMAKRFLAQYIVPDLIITSGAKRAYKTAKIFAETLKVAPLKIQVNDKLFHAHAHTILQLMQSQNEDKTSIMIFGHNPGLTDFANMIGDSYIDNLPTSGIYGISWSGQWNNLGNSKGNVFLFDYPKKKK